MQQLRLIKESGRDPELVLAELPLVLERLGTELRELLQDFWTEPARARAWETATAFSDDCQRCRLKGAQALLRSLSSLLSLAPGDAQAIRTPLSEKFDELIQLLREELSPESVTLPEGRRAGGSDREG